MNQSIFLNNKLHFLLIIFGAIILGFFLRLYPGKDNFIWNDIDTARDSYTIRSIIEEKNIILLGPKSERTVIYHGPLYYYFLAPFYFLSRGDPNLPVIAMIILNLSTLVPLYLLSKELFKNNFTTYCVLFLFVVSYEQVEYSRWLLNPSASIPFLAWFYYFFWKKFNNAAVDFFLGLALGLATQCQIFLSYLNIFILLALIGTKSKIQNYALYLSGFLLGIAPLVLSEFKFNFRATKALFTDVLTSNTYHLPWDEVLKKYFNHMGLTAKHAVFGLPETASLILLIGLVAYSIWLCVTTKKNGRPLAFILLWLSSHSVLFVEDVNAIFLDIGIGIAMILLAGFVINFHIKTHRYLIFFLLLTFSILQFKQLYIATINFAPFEKHAFWKKSASTYKEKIEIAAMVYELAPDDSMISISVLDAPYGSRTEWASVFEQYSRRENVPLPQWYGLATEGEFGGDWVLQKTDHPAIFHYVLKPNYLVIDSGGRELFYQQQNVTTSVIEIKELHDFIIEIRQPI
jgi:hypothetical protein